MRTAKQSVRQGCLTLFILSLCCALLIGAAPALFTLSVDPYELFGDRPRENAVSQLAEKDHYPLWKLARYQPGKHDTVVLGDSRARALRDKYWHELGMRGAINLAYGGGTIPEIHATFNLIKSDPSIRNLVIGIQLRSLDEHHKGGMNRVPEAIKLLEARLEYVKNWSVAKTAFKIFRAENKQTVDVIDSLTPSFVSAARAGEIGASEPVSLRRLLSPEICFSCALPRDVGSMLHRHRAGRYSIAHLPRWDSVVSDGYWAGNYPADYSALYVPQLTERVLPSKIRRQINRNGSADWRSFEISARYWSMLREIENWARQPGRSITFVIPPTIVEMQATIAQHGLSEVNLGLRYELAKLGSVLDFDFPNTLTSAPGNFSDAYHFKPAVARAIVGELAAKLTTNDDTRRRVSKRRGIIRCPQDVRSHNLLENSNRVVMSDDRNCRSWTHEVL